jgi:hypothetical protein
MSLSKRQKREQETREKRLRRRAFYVRKRQKDNMDFKVQKEIGKLLNPGITIRNPSKEVKDESQGS